MGAHASMRRFWDARAREDPFFFVDNRLEYGRPDAERFWRGGEELLDAALGRVGETVRPTDGVVEIGCGIGRITRALARRARRVWALDVSPEMLHRARALNAGLDNVQWVAGDGHTLAALEGASADLCYSDVVFQHVPDPAITLGYVREMGRVLRPGGRALFQVSNDPRVHMPPALPARLRGAALALLGRAPRGQTHPAWLGTPTDLDELEAVAGRVGLRVERVAGRGTQFCHVLLRRRG